MQLVTMSNLINDCECLLLLGHPLSLTFRQGFPKSSYVHSRHINDGSECLLDALALFVVEVLVLKVGAS